MSLTRTEAMKMLIQRGLILRTSENPAIDWIFMDSEYVGIAYETRMFLAKYLPSAIGLKYQDVEVPKRIFLFNSVDEPLRLEKMIDDLLDTPRRYEEDQRSQKIENMKRYFNDKRISAEHSQKEMTT